jgi:exodeoxyribonuclease V beta subunit
VLFYIGDPKQSIYSWRKADLKTYYQARNSILPRKRFDMKVNFRSSKQLIKALNHFFQPIAGFNTFENEIEAQNRIDYIQVTSAKEDGKGLFQHEQEFSPIRIINNHGNKTEIYSTIEASIKFLFFGGLKLNDQKVKPSNVCVLTRTNKQSKAVKDILNKLAIPSVISDDSKVINSYEAKELLFLLEAILTPQKSSIQKVFMTQFLNYSVDYFKNLDFDYYIELFTFYGKTWAKDGVYVALNALLTEFDIIQKLQKKDIAGQRVISNLKQLIELLQEKELRNSFTPNETYLFLQNQIKSTSDAEVSEYAQRLENDEDTVKIVTIHKSKGMEYDIVIAPFLDFDESEMFDLSSLRLQTNNQENNYIFVTNPIVNATHKTLYASQQKQENRRLIYVALTRAKYNLIIINKSHKNIKGGGKSEITHALTDFVKAIQLSPLNIQLIDKEDIEQVDLGKLDLDDDQLQPIQKPLPELLFPDSNYKKMSYSYLAAHPAKGAKEQLADYDKNSYEYFVFKDLPKGANIGNLLHDIFEFIDYTSNAKWREIIEKLVIRYIPVYKDKPLFLEYIFELVNQTLNANISFAVNAFQLSSLSREKRKNEFEFNFAIPNDFNISELENVLDDETRKIQTNNNKVKGMMTGFIDLFFEHDNKYYILDWKSNFLGDSITDFDRVGVEQAMNESNYHLQYLIYALALDKYLTSKLPGFDFEQQFGGVIYLFLRGNREGEQTGVFTQKVTNEELTKLKNVLQIY